MGFKTWLLAILEILCAKLVLKDCLIYYFKEIFLMSFFLEVLMKPTVDQFTSIQARVALVILSSCRK